MPTPSDWCQAETVPQDYDMQAAMVQQPQHFAALRSLRTSIADCVDEDGEQQLNTI